MVNSIYEPHNFSTKGLIESVVLFLKYQFVLQALLRNFQSCNVFPTKHSKKPVAFVLLIRSENVMARRSTTTNYSLTVHSAMCNNSQWEKGLPK